MTTIKRAVVAVLLMAALAPVSAQRTIDLDQVTIADVNAAFAKGTLTSERLTRNVLRRALPMPTSRAARVVSRSRRPDKAAGAS